MKKIGSLFLLLVFIVAVAYIAGMVWFAVFGQSCPEGVRWFYPWMPSTFGISSGGTEIAVKIW